ncbi:MAG: hypothetical protein C0405_12990, partial [Desulfovibrio sp.]|nr:hypothetical protein [Desulfovibrio sp.]
MADEPKAPPAPRPAARTASLLYAASLAALLGVLLAEFFVAYQLLVDHPSHSPGLIKETYGAMLLGVGLLAGQAVLVYAGLLKPVRENSIEILRLKESLEQHCHHDELTKVLNR